MKPGRVYAVVLRHVYLVRGSFARVFPLFAWAAIDIVLWGFLTRYLNTVGPAGVNFIPVFLGAVLIWDFFIRVMQGVTMAFFEDVWSRNFLNLFATPLSVSEYVAGLVLSSIGTSSIGLAVMILLATTAFGLSLAAYGLMVVPFLLVLFVFGLTLGLFACALMLRLGPAAEWFVWPIPAVVSPFAGVFYPVATLPAWMQAVAYALPPAYVFEGLRAVVAGGTVAGGALARGAVLAALYLLLACRLFVRTYRHTVRTGLLARYTAESVS